MELAAFLQPGTEIHCYGRGISAFDVGMRRFISGDVISNTLLGYGLCICRERRRGGSVRCGSEETPNSILQEAGSKRRAARTADTVVMRIERSNEATERRALAKGSKRLYPRALLESLDVRIKQNEWESALRVFELVRIQEWYTAEVSTYVKLLTMLARVKQPQAASNLFDFLLQDKLRPTLEIFTALITVFTKSNLLKKAFEVFEQMRLFDGCLPDKYAYTTMIKGCCDAGLYDQAKKLFNEMMREGVEPTIVTYNTLIFGYGKAGLFAEIEYLLSLMEANGITPDTITWNTLIRVFGLHNRIPEMEQAYEGLLAQGLMADEVTLNSLIGTYGRAGLYGKMECVTDFMRRYSYPMTTVTYNIIIEIYGKARKIEQMDTAFKRMKAQGLKPNCITFSSILSAYGKHGEWHKIEKIMRQVRHYNAADTAVYNAAIDAHRRALDFEAMEKLFEEMKMEGVAPDGITYTTLIEAYGRVRKLQKARELQEEWDALKK
ncbi:uncharacterized protein [Physcomitrium patens]|uniref:uncharacterized protein isoform X1 n=1 Tax=Physcomitrium patens TaxID=3218 RepID=UPI000D1635F9|nr:pentatricopeptide repeat-containing protein At3g53170-like isoform X2 [Physcomitrium patens]|eukprot:XP_024358535.1 pentatricopeptide repeat-containing protein At3g53170-like isoform X2 [Physcomitrella patens]